MFTKTLEHIANYSLIKLVLCVQIKELVGLRENIFTVFNSISQSQAISRPFL